MSAQTVRAAEIRVGDVILSESSRYHGPDLTVDEILMHEGRNEWHYSFVGHWGTKEVHHTRLNGAPADKPYLVERAS